MPRRRQTANFFSFGYARKRAVPSLAKPQTATTVRCLTPAIPFVSIPLCCFQPANFSAGFSSLRSISLLNRRRQAEFFSAFTLHAYPIGLSGGGNFPLWKRASVASEPDFDMGGLPMFYIDTATKQGMSGSPVYVQESGMWREEGKKFPDEATLGTGIRFVGIYSGRLDGTEFIAQIGKVWKEEAIRQIIAAKLIGKSSFDCFTRS